MCVTNIEQPHVCSFQGVLRIHFIEAQDLQGKDTYLKGLVKGKSDPYGVIRVGNQIFQSKVIKENLSPKWNEVYEVSGPNGVLVHPGPPACLMECASVRWNFCPNLTTFLVMPTYRTLNLNPIKLTINNWQIVFDNVKNVLSH